MDDHRAIATIVDHRRCLRRLLIFVLERRNQLVKDHVLLRQRQRRQLSPQLTTRIRGQKVREVEPLGPSATPNPNRCHQIESQLGQIEQIVATERLTV
jgi:hypothetical protein